MSLQVPAIPKGTKKQPKQDKKKERSKKMPTIQALIPCGEAGPCGESCEPERTATKKKEARTATTHRSQETHKTTRGAKTEAEPRTRDRPNGTRKRRGSWNKRAKTPPHRVCVIMKQNVTFGRECNVSPSQAAGREEKEHHHMQTCWAKRVCVPAGPLLRAQDCLRPPPCLPNFSLQCVHQALLLPLMRRCVRSRNASFGPPDVSNPHASVPCNDASGFPGPMLSEESRVRLHGSCSRVVPSLLSRRFSCKVHVLLLYELHLLRT